MIFEIFILICLRRAFRKAYLLFAATYATNLRQSLIRYLIVYCSLHHYIIAVYIILLLILHISLFNSLLLH